MDEADGGVLLVRVDGAALLTLTRKVFKLHAHRHRVGLALQGRRHRALNGFLGFTRKRNKIKKENITSGWRT